VSFSHQQNSFSRFSEGCVQSTTGTRPQQFRWSNSNPNSNPNGNLSLTLTLKRSYVDKNCTLRSYNKAIVDYTAHAVHSRHPLPADRRCGLSSTCRRRTEPQTSATCTKIGKDRACGSATSLCGSEDILADRQTDTQTDISQYFATAPAGKVIMSREHKSV